MGDEVDGNFSINVTEFRLKRINEIKDKIEKDKIKREKSCHKYKLANNVTEVLDAGFIIICVACSGTGVGTIVFPPLATGFGIAASVSGFFSLITKAVSKKLISKHKLHSKILILSEVKLTKIYDLISKAIEDEKITDEEFEIITQEFTNFINEKREIKMKNKPNSDEDLRTLLGKSK